MCLLLSSAEAREDVADGGVERWRPPARSGEILEEHDVSEEGAVGRGVSPSRGLPARPFPLIVARRVKPPSEFRVRHEASDIPPEYCPL